MSSCWRPTPPCQSDVQPQPTGVVCEALYTCPTRGQYFIRWSCGFSLLAPPSDVIMCAAQTMSDPACPPPVVCPHVGGQQYGANYAVSSFPTEAVLGGTLGGLSVIALALLVYAAFRHWQRTRRRHPPPHRRGQSHRKKNMLAVFGDPLFAYDVTGLPKSIHAYAHMQPDVYIARPHVSARRLASQRHALAAMLDPRDDSSEREFCPRSGAGGLGGGDDSHYEPSIIAGSFVYHPPTNLPPHLTRGSHALPHTHIPGGGGAGSQHDGHHDLSYDSFKNDHLYDSATRGMASSTLNNHHQPPDFYL